MIENLLPIKLPPGLFYKGTQYQSKGRWYLGSLVRFFQGNIQPVGGWVQRATSGATISGTPNAAVSWRINDGTAYLAIGTTTGLYVVSSTNVVSNITPVTGLGGTPYQWQLETFGSYLMACHQAPSSLAAGVGSPIFDGINYYAWTGNPATPAAVPQIPTQLSSSLTAPTAAYGIVATPERFFFLLRGSDPVTPTSPPSDVVVDAGGGTWPNYSVRRVYWASQETITEWGATDTDTAGSFDLATNGDLVTGRAIRGQTLIWSTTDAWTATYIGGEFIYRFDRVGMNCGIMASNACVILDIGAFWMGVNQKFFLFDGFVKTLDCDVSDYVFGSFNTALSSLVWALANPQFNEITWFYPSAAATAPDRYVTYNYSEGHWSVGLLQRSIGVTQFAGAATPVPVMINSSGQIFNHETGDARGASSGVFLKSGPVEPGDGDQIMKIQRVVPDDKTAGDVTVTLTTSLFPDATGVDNGPYTLASPTSVRLAARQVLVTLTESAATAWRVGIVRLGVIMSGRR